MLVEMLGSLPTSSERRFARDYPLPAVSARQAAFNRAVRLMRSDRAKALRRAFLAFGDRVEFDHNQQIATVYARPFPRAQTQQAYERLCSVLADVPIMLTRNGVNYRLLFSW